MHLDAVIESMADALLAYSNATGNALKISVDAHGQYQYVIQYDGKIEDKKGVAFWRFYGGEWGHLEKGEVEHDD